MKYCFLILSILFSGFASNASHIVGFTLHAGYAGTANDYTVTYKIYRNCSGPPAALVYAVRYEKDGGFLGTVFLNQISSSVHNNQLCILSQPVNCAGGFGIEELTYEATVSLVADGTYRFYVASEPAAVQEANYAEMYIVKEPGLHNKLPVFSSNPEFNFCLNININYPSFAISPDGDSIVYSIAGARVYTPSTQTVIPFFYLPGNSLHTFNISMSPAVISSASGTVTFTPTQVAQGLMVVKADEYRNGVWLGSVMRQTSVIVSGNGTGIESFKKEKIIIAPNPVTDRIYITSDQPVEQYEITDVSGRLIETEKGCLNNEIEISFDGVGLYFLKVMSGNEVSTLRFLKAH